MTNTAQDEFIQSLEGELTPEQAAQLLGLQGDSGEELQTGSEPDTSTVSGDGDSPQGDAGKNDTNTEVADTGKTAPEAELDSTNAVILAKDGKHTIPYDRLTEARERAQGLSDQLRTANEELSRLRADAQQRVDAGQAPTVADNQLAAAQAAVDAGADITLFGTFSEEDIAKGIQTLVGQRVSAEVEKALAPLRQGQQEAAVDAHNQPIYDKHPDADSIYESKEFADWKAAQPAFARAGMEAVLANGSAQEVIELFDSFKQATGSTQAATDTKTPAVDVKAAAKAAVAKAAVPVPASLSDFPAGRVGAGSRVDAMADMSSGVELLNEMDGMSTEQLESFLNRRG